MAHCNKSRMDYIGFGCCALACVLYLNTLNAGFVYDDRRAVLGNPDVLATTPWNQLLVNDYWGTPLIDSGSHGSYRPFSVLTFKLNHIVGGFRPYGYHLVNILLHVTATGLVVKLSRRLSTSIWCTGITGALFAAHPIHTEAVAGIVGRADLVACNFYLLTFLTYSKHIVWREYGEHKQWYALGGTILFAVCALLAKETAITALVLCGLFDIIRAFCGTQDKHRLRSLTILGVVLIALLQIRLSLPGPTVEFSTADNPIAKNHSIWTRFLTFIYLPVFNFNLMMNPSQLSFDWGMDSIQRITSLTDYRNIITCIFFTLLAYVIHVNIQLMKNRLPLIIRRRKMVRITKKYKQQQQQQQNHHQIHHHQNQVQTQLYTATTTTTYHINNNQYQQHPHHHSQHSKEVQQQLNSHQVPSLDTICTVCKHGLNQRHSSTCRIINNNNGPVSAAMCECPSYRRSSPSPLKSTLRLTELFHRIEKVSSIARTIGNGGHSQHPVHKKPIEYREKSTEHLSDLNVVEPSSSATILLSIAFMVLPFLPATNLFFYVGFVVAERILYLPSVGYCLLIGMGASKLLECCRKKRLRYLIIFSLSVMVLVFSGKTFIRNYDWNDEESLYRSAISVNPPKALGNLGSVLSSQGRYDEAKLALTEALKYRPNMADVHYNLGILLQNQQNHKDAVDCFQKAIQFRPSLALAYLNLGTSLIALGRCKEAANILRTGSKLELGIGVRDRTAHENARIASLLQLGSLYAEQGKLKRALAVYREILHTLPKHYPPQAIYQRLGDTLARLQQWSEAERFHRAALEVQPDHVATHISYGTMLARNSSRTSEAEQWFKRAIKLAPNDPSVHHHYAEFLSTVSRHDEAVEQRILAAELAPKDYALVVSAATALRMAERKTEAESWYRLAVQLRPDDARSHTNLGAMLHLLGKTTEAVDCYRQALRLLPGDPTTIANLAKLGVSEVA